MQILATTTDQNCHAFSEGKVILLRVYFGGREAVLEGREAWALAELIDAGEDGVTPLERPAPRWSHYVFLLRRRGLIIETVPEVHGGAYAGRHGRYVLRSPVEVVAVRRTAR